jgi:GT2 family glycosyltransferase
MATAVLIVNYRAYDSLTACLASLNPQLDDDDEVCVVDYESDAQALAASLRGCPRVTAVSRTDNRGFAAGVNLAAAETQAPYLLLLNPDSIVDEPVTKRLAAWMTEHPDVAVAGPRILNSDGTVQRSARRFPDATTVLGGRSTWLSARFPGNWFSRRNLVDASAPVDVDWVSGACLITRRAVFDAVGGFDDQFFLYWEDADYCRRVVTAGGRCVYAPIVSVRHIGGRSAERDRVLALRAFHDSAYRLFVKHAGVGGRLIAPLVRGALNVRAAVRIRAARRDQGRGAA